LKLVKLQYITVIFRVAVCMRYRRCSVQWQWWYRTMRW